MKHIKNNQKYSIFAIIILITSGFIGSAKVESENYTTIHAEIDTSSSSVVTVENNTFDYVIITSSVLESSVEFFKNWKNLIGFSVKVVNISWIHATYAGRDSAEQIKSFLQDVYAKWSVRFVLLVGDGDIVPWRYCYKPNDDNFAIPSDFYYADLSSDWDSDGDGMFAEFGEDNWPDFTSEVYVGRIPVNDADGVSDICRKIILFEQNDGAWKNNVLMVGAITNFKNEVGLGNPKTDTAVMMELLKEDILQPAGFSTTTLYEKQGLSPSEYTSDLALTAENVINSWKNGYGIVTWGSHGEPTYSYSRWWAKDKNLNNVPDFDEIDDESFITRTDVFTLSDEKPSFVFSCSCSNANPENPENLGKALLKHGAVGFIGAAHYSYYTFGWDEKNDGGTMSVTYHFFTNFITQHQSTGEALYNSLSYCWENEEIAVIDPNMYVFTLYGDPSLSLSSYSGLLSPAFPAKPSGESFLKPDVSYSFATSTNLVDGKEVYYVWDFGDGTLMDPLGPYESGKTMNISHIYNVPGNYRIKVKVVNKVGDESLWSEPLLVQVSGPIIKIEQISGGLLKVNAVIRNIGDQEATNVAWSIILRGGAIFLGKSTNGIISSLPAGGKQTVISKTIYGLGFPSVVMVEAGVTDGSSDVEVQSADVILSFIRIN